MMAEVTNISTYIAAADEFANMDNVAVLGSTTVLHVASVDIA
eukprot:IDg10396t1